MRLGDNVVTCEMKYETRQSRIYGDITSFDRVEVIECRVLTVDGDRVALVKENGRVIFRAAQAVFAKREDAPDWLTASPHEWMRKKGEPEPDEDRIRSFLSA